MIVPVPGGTAAVTVWVHGGAFSTDSGSWPLYDGADLASRGDAVVVTINHRLGPFGFLHLAELSDDDRYRDSGNAGMLDIVLALVKPARSSPGRTARNRLARRRPSWRARS